MLAPLSSSSMASSTWPPHAARVSGDSKLSAGMFTWRQIFFVSESITIIIIFYISVLLTIGHG